MKLATGAVMRPYILHFHKSKLLIFDLFVSIFRIKNLHAQEWESAMQNVHCRNGDGKGTVLIRYIHTYHKTNSFSACLPFQCAFSFIRFVDEFFKVVYSFFPPKLLPSERHCAGMLTCRLEHDI